MTRIRPWRKISRKARKKERQEMRTKLPALAAALLLAASTAVRADDLLDIVLWDGPSAFPSTAAPEPEPPPPEPEPAPAPVYPSRSSYTLRTPAPDLTPPPAALNPPQPLPFPAVSDPVSLPGETQIRREIQEMRARADRLEAALGPTAPPEPAQPANPPYDRADWPKRARLSIHGFGDPSSPGCGGIVGEFALPLAETPFDVALQGYYLANTPDAEHGDGYYFTESKEVAGGTLWGVCYPWRNAVVAPHIGIGIGYERVGGEVEYIQRGENRYQNLDDKKPTLAGRIGVTLTVKRFTLKGEIILTSETKTYLAEAGLRIWEHLVLNVLVERLDMDLEHSDSRNVVGGGATILF